MLLTPTYHAFNMYKGHKDALLMPSHLKTEEYEFDGEKIPAISSSASLADDGSMTITMSNVNPNKTVSLDIHFVGKNVKHIEAAVVLTAPAVNSINTFEETDTVSPVEFKDVEKTSDHSLRVELPAKSIISIKVN